jgi:hypothetical protein
MKKDEFQIKVNLEEMTIGDFEAIQTGKAKGMSLTEQLDLLDKFIDGDVRQLKIKQINLVLDEIRKATEGIVSGEEAKN